MSHFIRIQRNGRIKPKKTIVNLLFNYADKHYELIIYSTRLKYASIHYSLQYLTIILISYYFLSLYFEIINNFTIQIKTP